MQPKQFPEQTHVLKRPSDMTEEECGDLGVYSDGNFCLSCWKASIRERLSILLFGKVWVFVHSGKTQPPIALLSAKSPFIEGPS
jgi:hypothetical protein